MTSCGSNLTELPNHTMRRMLDFNLISQWAHSIFIMSRSGCLVSSHSAIDVGRYCCVSQGWRLIQFYFPMPGSIFISARLMIWHHRVLQPTVVVHILWFPIPYGSCGTCLASRRPVACVVPGCLLRTPLFPWIYGRAIAVRRGLRYFTGVRARPRRPCRSARGVRGTHAVP